MNLSYHGDRILLLTLRMRDVDVIVLTYVSERIETCIQNRDDFCRGSSWARLNIRCDDIKYSYFGHPRMARDHAVEVMARETSERERHRELLTSGDRHH